jgi:inorganic triphosphatase YgiF
MIEHELRFALTSSMAAEFEQRATIGLTRPCARLLSRYFDSAAGDLVKAAVSLRVRQTPDGYLQTVKARASAAFARYEWERPIAGEDPEFDALPPESHPVGALVRGCFGRLAMVFETDLERQVRLVRPQPGVRVELACDRGEIRVGPRSERVAEVAIERKEGSTAAFYHYAMQWARLHQAQLVLAPKSVRGQHLAGLRSDKPRPLARPAPAPRADLPPATAARQILSGHLDHFLANIAPVQRRRDPQGPQQLQIALDRFRAAIRFFGLRQFPAGTDASSAGLTGMWRRLDQAAGALADSARLVRGADLLETGLIAVLRQRTAEDAALTALEGALAGERERERARLRATVASSEVSGFVVEALAAIECLPQDGWPDASFGAFAERRIAKLARRLRRRTRRARCDSHWRRIQVRTGNLRRTLESLAGLGPAALPIAVPIAEAIAELARIEAALAVGADLAVAQEVARRALAQPTAPVEVAVRAAALVDGYCAFAPRPDDRHDLRQALLAVSTRLLPASDQRGGGRQATGTADPLPADASGPNDLPADEPAADTSPPQAPPARMPEDASSGRTGDGSGYHPEMALLRMPDKPATALPHVESCKEDPE